MIALDSQRRELGRLVRHLAVLPALLLAALLAVLVWEILHGDSGERPVFAVVAVALLSGAALSVFAVRQMRALAGFAQALQEEYASRLAARDQFLSIASHELKTPLTSLQLQLQSLLRLVGGDPPADERIAQKVRTATRSAERLGELVNRLLEVSRLTTGKLELAPEALDLAELAREVAARFAEPLAEGGIVLSVQAPVSVRGRWDRGRVETIAASMISNAIKYGGGKPIDLGVEARGPLARLWVRDRGIGIAPEDQARIFERFERAVPEHHYVGFGVGLWVARLVAEAHGGRIGVESRPGQGSTFSLELPRRAST